MTISKVGAVEGQHESMVDRESGTFPASGRRVRGLHILLLGAEPHVGLEALLLSAGAASIAHAQRFETSDLHLPLDMVFVPATTSAEDLKVLLNGIREGFPDAVTMTYGDLDRDSLVGLLRAGAGGHLDWPASVESARRAMSNACDSDGLMELFAARLLGRLSLRDAQSILRRALLRQAMVAVQGSVRASARLLGVTRPAVQKMLREGEHAPPSLVSPDGE